MYPISFGHRGYMEPVVQPAVTFFMGKSRSSLYRVRAAFIFISPVLILLNLFRKVYGTPDQDAPVI
jgi:hypothetical protein